MTLRTAIAIVSACSNRRRDLKAALRQDGASPLIVEAADRSAALRLLTGTEVSVIVSDVRLRDGDWKDFLSHTAAMPCPPRLIVIAPSDSASLWAEVLNLGGYDVLLEPLDANEIRRVTAAAMNAWHGARDARPRKPVSSAQAGVLAIGAGTLADNGTDGFATVYPQLLLHSVRDA
jgi:DNA-binding NtrC family response regulator